jgi:HEAT repeat protein
MARNGSSCLRGHAVVVTATLIIYGFGLLFVAATASPMAQTQSSATSQPSSSRTGGQLVIVGTDVRDKTINFGDELVVLVTLQNQGKEPIRIPTDSLVLKNEGWSNYSGYGSGLGESPLLRAGIFDKEEFTLQPGESVALIGSNREMAAQSLGSMKAEFIIETENKNLLLELGKPKGFSVSYFVAPSTLLASAWAARTPEERRRLLPQIRDLLLLASRAEEWRDRNYVEGTLTYMACHALPLLESALKDTDPIVRQQAVRALMRSGWAADSLNFFIADLLKKNEGQTWAASVGKCDERHALRESIRLATARLSDPDPSVRIAAISVLTTRAAIEANLRRYLANNPGRLESMDEQSRQRYESVGLVDPALPLVKKMGADADPGVRAEAQKFLSNFAAQPGVAGEVVVSLGDPDAGVRSQALKALKSSHEPPPLTTTEQAFALTKGEVALGLIELIYEREDSELASRLTPGFKGRSAAERLMILTAIAGHTDDAALNLVISGLKDSDNDVRRAALMRLLGFPTPTALSLIKADSAVASRDVGAAVQRELESRKLLSFLAYGGSAAESVFPSVQGTGPVVSPDGKWVAYVETGWGHPGGSGGMGRSNLLSITHVARRDGSLDRVVSDMFLVGWMSDSQRLASTRDGFAAIVNLTGKTVTEFGDRLDKPDTGGGFSREVWPTGEIRQQFGVRMPHAKGFQPPGMHSEEIFSFDSGEDAAVSPDGKWFGPRRVKDQWQFIDPEGNKRELKAPDRETLWGSQAVWSPDGACVVVGPVEPSGSFGRDKGVEPGKAFVIDFGGLTLKAVIEVDQVWGMGGWNYRKGRWNPWSRDGKRLAFIRQGQVWTSDPDGNATQLTFDGSNKVFPTFSPDGTKMAYITWQFDNREHYTRLGPTDIWVVDIKTRLAARVTRADSSRIEGLDWLDNSTLIYDRLHPDDRHSTLRTVSLR